MRPGEAALGLPAPGNTAQSGWKLGGEGRWKHYKTSHSLLVSVKEEMFYSRSRTRILCVFFTCQNILVPIWFLVWHTRQSLCVITTPTWWQGVPGPASEAPAQTAPRLCPTLGWGGKSTGMHKLFDIEQTVTEGLLLAGHIWLSQQLVETQQEPFCLRSSD